MIINSIKFGEIKIYPVNNFIYIDIDVFKKILFDLKLFTELIRDIVRCETIYATRMTPYKYNMVFTIVMKNGPEYPKIIRTRDNKLIIEFGEKNDSLFIGHLNNIYVIEQIGISYENYKNLLLRRLSTNRDKYYNFLEGFLTLIPVN